MANLKVDWVLPTTRKSGRPLSASEIDFVEIFLSANGTDFGSFGKYEADVLSTVITDLEPGVWSVRGQVVDTLGRTSGFITSSFEILDSSPPSELVSLSLSLA